MRVSSFELRRLRLVIVLLGLSVAAVPLLSRAQDPAEQAPPAEPVAVQPAVGKSSAMPSIWDLTVQGGVFMIPLALISIVVVAYAIERTVGLRRKKILPPKLLAGIQQLSSEESGIDPRQASKVCQQHPSPLANVIRAAISKIGRPHSEMEQAVQDAIGREADEMSDNLRPINVSASVAPLIGLLGTVQGMIVAFMVTSTTTATGAAKAQELAQGIYTALVTTFGGLSIAVPALLIANWLESRIDRLLRGMEDLFLEVLPQFERFETKLRIRRTVEEGTKAGASAKATTTKPAVPSPKPVAISKSPETVELSTPKGKGLWSVMGANAETAGET